MLDHRLQQLERQVQAQPDDLGTIQALARMSERVGWRFEDLSLDDIRQLITTPQLGSRWVLPASFTIFRRLDPRVVPSLIELLDLPDPDIQWSTLNALSLLGPKACAATPKVLDLLESPDELLWRHARWCLVRLNRHQPEALLPQLANQARRERLITALGHFGSYGGQGLIEALQGLSDSSSGAALIDQALMRLRGPKEWPVQLTAGHHWLAVDRQQSDSEFLWLDIWNREVSTTMAFCQRMNQPLVWPDLETQSHWHWNQMDEVCPYAVIVPGSKLTITAYDWQSLGLKYLGCESTNARPLNHDQVFFEGHRFAVQYQDSESFGDYYCRLERIPEESDWVYKFTLNEWPY